MKQMIYSIYDSKVKVFANPFYMRNGAEALRAWSNTVNDPKTQFALHPADYTLFELGEFNDEDGQIVMHNSFVNLGNGLQFKKEQQPMEGNA